MFPWVSHHKGWIIISQASRSHLIPVWSGLNGNSRIQYMEVLYHVRPYFVGIFPYVAFTQALYRVGTINFSSCCMAIGLWGNRRVAIRSWSTLSPCWLSRALQRPLPWATLWRWHLGWRGDVLPVFTIKDCGWTKKAGGTMLIWWGSFDGIFWWDTMVIQPRGFV